MNNEKPCLVSARHGFSVLYKDRYLYSKYDPIQNCERLVSSLTILPGTLIIVFSPLLGYGLASLLQKIDKGSFVIGLETDPVLYDFSKDNIQEQYNHPQFKYIAISQNNQGISDFLNICSAMVKVEKTYFFKRLISLSFAASEIPEAFKTSLIKYTDSFIDSFWKNRITLIKMGRLYARNIFKNLPYLSKSFTLVQNSIAKPILVLGAGISLEETLSFLKNTKDDFFIICVDTALMPLLEHGIKPNMVIAVECQLANTKAFIGSNNVQLHLDSDLSSRPRMLLQGRVSYFLSEYEQSAFLNRLKKTISIRTLPPLGSVGLVAVHTALYIRKDSTPIFLSGLDFCYEPGKTHCRGAPQHRFSLTTSNRLNIPNSSSGFFSKSTVRCTHKSNSITDANLKKYALLFEEEFSGFDNLFNLSKKSLITKIPYMDIKEIKTFYNSTFPKSDEANSNFNTGFFKKNHNKQNTITSFLKTEKDNLLKIKDSLINGSLDELSLFNLLEQHDYLYMHFPDGYKKPNMSQGFLKRVRAEIDFFLKDIETALSQK